MTCLAYARLVQQRNRRHSLSLDSGLQDFERKSLKPREVQTRRVEGWKSSYPLKVRRLDVNKPEVEEYLAIFMYMKKCNCYRRV